MNLQKMRFFRNISIELGSLTDLLKYVLQKHFFAIYNCPEVINKIIIITSVHGNGCMCVCEVHNFIISLMDIEMIA